MGSSLRGLPLLHGARAKLHVEYRPLRMWALDRRSVLWAWYVLVSSHNGWAKRAPMQRAPRVGLEALTIARGTSALGPACSNKPQRRQRFLPLRLPIDLVPDSLHACAMGRLEQLQSFFPVVAIPALTSGDPSPTPNYLIVFSDPRCSLMVHMLSRLPCRLACCEFGTQSDHCH